MTDVNSEARADVAHVDAEGVDVVAASVTADNGSAASPAAGSADAAASGTDDSASPEATAAAACRCRRCGTAVAPTVDAFEAHELSCVAPATETARPAVGDTPHAEAAGGWRLGALRWPGRTRASRLV